MTSARDAHNGRWVTLVIVIVAAFIVVVDNTVLNVAIPTILREFDTSLPTLEWVVTGYALTFATLLIIGGRLGDVYGHRRIFIIGAALFGVGSLLASLSTSVAHLIVGEAVIEGIGASLMLPATLAILSTTFHGRERATAFAAWGATAGVAAASGPVVGGFLTSNYSWRWSFRINVIIAPLAIVGALLFMPAERGTRRRVGIDLPGAALVAVAMFLLVFGLSEGGRYGWWSATDDFSLGGWTLWPQARGFSVVPVVVVLGLAVLVLFTAYERRRERHDRDPLFELSHLRFATYRYGLLTGLVFAVGQLGLAFVLPVFLQGARHLSAAENGLWFVPTGLFVILGAQLGGRLTRMIGTTAIVRIGLFMYAAALAYIVFTLSADVTLLGLLPGFALYGIGVGFAGAQLTNVVLSEVPRAASGVASGANTTVRQVGMALGVAVIGALLTAQTVSHATGQIEHAALPADVKTQAIGGVQALGTNYSPGTRFGAESTRVVEHAVEAGIVSGARSALLFATVLVTLGALLSFLIPRRPPTHEHVLGLVESMEPVEPLDVDPVLVGD